jgi:Mrp family chromosome partitioning ATPase
MRTLLSELEQQADLVIVDTAATLAVSDSLPLIQAASGIVMIVRMNRSSRAAVRRLQKVIAATHGTIMGVVATGASSVTYGYGGDGYYVSENGNGPGRRGRLRRRRRGSTAEHHNGASAGPSIPEPVAIPEPLEPPVA